MELQTIATQSLWFPGIVNNSICVGYLVGTLWWRIGSSQGLKPRLTFLTSQTRKKQSVRDAECIVLWAWNDKGVPALQYQYSYLTCMSLCTVLYSLLFFLYLFSCFVFYCVYSVFLYCLVYCFSFVYSSLFPIFVQVYWPLPPGGKPIAVNKYIIFHTTSHHVTSRHVTSHHITSYIISYRIVSSID